MKISFHGAAGTVTGSRFLVESARARILVDCGLFQGIKALRLRNWQPFPVDPKQIDAVVLTHAHLDHSGYLPALIRRGFGGPVYATPPTRALCGILLPDSGKIQEEDARYADRKRFSKHKPALPLYTQAEAEAAIEHFRDLPFETEATVGDLTLRMRPAGHILGAASVEVSDGQRRVLFSGDLGRQDDLLMRPPAPPPAVDALVMESTYGDRLHAGGDPIAAIASVLRRTRERGGVLLMPSFTVGRAQTLLLCLHRLFTESPEERVPVYVNSPMATNATELYRRFVDYHRLGPEECEDVCSGAEFVRSVDESRRLNERRSSAVIIAGSGMCTGGRILHHLRAFAPERRNTILLPGFQAPGTRGAAIAAGADSVKIHGDYVSIRAEVLQLDLLSAHADRAGLITWLRGAERPPKQIFLVHGEPVAADDLRRRIAEETGATARIPEQGASVEVH